MNYTKCTHNFAALVVSLLFLPACPAPASAEPAAVTRDIRIGVHGSTTRLVLETDKAIVFSAFVLARPDRIVIDLPKLDFKLKRGGPRRRGLISNLRYGLFRPGQSRLVLDLAKPALIGTSFVLPPVDGAGYRTVIDLKPTSRAKFTAALKPPKRKTVRRKPVKSPKKPAGAKPVVIIDPGHGGVDPGTISTSGIYEKRITLSFARQLKKHLAASRKYKIVLTRERDVFRKLRDRVDFARSQGGDLFISIHADSIADKQFRGSGVYTLSERASDKEAEALASKENKSDVIAGVDLDVHDEEVATILIDLTQRETMNYSAIFAEALVKRLRDEGRMRRKPHRFAGFLVLKAPDVPSILVEIGYLSNRQEEKLLMSPKKRRGIVNAIAKAVDDYFAKRGR